MKIVVKEESTLLKYLEENLDMSKRNIKKYLKNGSIYVDGTRTTQFDYPLMVDSIVVIDTNKKKLNKIPFAVLYEDENIIVVDKPAGLLTIASAKEKEQTTYHIVREYLRAKNKHAKIFIIHRLDKETSGVLMFAKNEYRKNVLQLKRNDLCMIRSFSSLVVLIID